MAFFYSRRRKTRLMEEVRILLGCELIPVGRDKNSRKEGVHILVVREGLLSDTPLYVVQTISTFRQLGILSMP